MNQSSVKPHRSHSDSGGKENNLERPCLNDKDEHPDDEVLTRHLGKVKRTWNAFVELIRESYPSFSAEWRYYNDGKSWLYKVTKKKQTICWVSVYSHAFKTTFYFPDRAEDLITVSGLKKDYTDQFIHGKRYGKIRGVTVTVTKPIDLETTRTLIGIKGQIK